MVKRNTTIDFYKYLASLLVISIHTSLFKDINEPAYFIVVQIVARMAVPFFAVSTGYFFASKIGSIDRYDGAYRQLFLKQWKKLIRLYFAWTIAYLIFSIPVWIRTGWFHPWAFIDYGVASVRSGSHYHLWYLLSLVYAWPIFCLIIRYVSNRYWMLLSVLLYCIEAVRYGYAAFTPVIVRRVLHIFDIVGGISDGVFLLLPFLLMGASICREERAKSYKEYTVKFAASVVLLAAEAWLLTTHGKESVAFIAFTYPVAYYLYRLLLCSKLSLDKTRRLCFGTVSLVVYCFHPMVIETMKNFSLASPLVFIITAVVATCVGLLWSHISVLRKERAATTN